jgi:hypothetical protein
MLGRPSTQVLALRLRQNLSCCRRKLKEHQHRGFWPDMQMHVCCPGTILGLMRFHYCHFRVDPLGRQSPSLSAVSRIPLGNPGRKSERRTQVIPLTKTGISKILKKMQSLLMLFAIHMRTKLGRGRSRF